MGILRQIMGILRFDYDYAKLWVFYVLNSCLFFFTSLRLCYDKLRILRITMNYVLITKEKVLFYSPNYGYITHNFTVGYVPITVIQTPLRLRPIMGIFFKTPKNDKLEVLRIDFRTHCVRRGSIYDILGLNSNSFVAIWILGTSKVCGASVPQTQVVYSNRYHYEDSGRHVACPHHPSYH